MNKHNNIDINKISSLSSKSAHLRMISEVSCDNEDWSNDAENSVVITQSFNISQYYIFLLYL